MEGDEEKIGAVPPQAHVLSQVLPDGLKGWLVASLVVLLASLLAFVVNVAMAFVYFTAKAPPLWVTVLGVIAVLGIAVGFGGVFLVFLLAVVKSRRHDKTTEPEQH